MVEDIKIKHHGSIVLIGGLGKKVFLAIATSMIARSATNVDCPMKIGQTCFCAVHDKHLFHISFNEALLIGAANSIVSKNNPETIDSVRKSNKNRPFLRISENFQKENKETNQTKETKKPKKTKHQKNQRFWQLVYLQQYLARSLVFLAFCFFCFFVFFFLVLLVAWASILCTV